MPDAKPLSPNDFLALERIEDNIYRGPSHDVGTGSVFGGQVAGQALRAAGRTVDAGRPAHSLHAYFMLPGDVEAPIVYEVHRIRDGNSFSTRRIVALQHGRAIFSLSASFHAREEGLAHQSDLPEVPPPEDVPTELELLQRLAEHTQSSVAQAYLRQREKQPWPFELRLVDPPNVAAPERRAPRQHVWVRSRGLSREDAPAADTALRQSMLVCISDYNLLSTALLPHGVWFGNGISQAASLDHAMWFHRPFDPEEWLLYAMDSPNAGGARGLARGAFYTQSGDLVASVAQEGLLRTPPE